MILTTDAEATADAFASLSDALGLPRAIRYEMKKRAREWRYAASHLAGSEDEAVIELATAIVPGMEVAMSAGWSVVIRKMERDGQVTLHVEHPDDPMPRYVNLHGPTSPVVVRG